MKRQGSLRLMLKSRGSSTALAAIANHVDTEIGAAKKNRLLLVLRSGDLLEIMRLQQGSCYCSSAFNCFLLTPYKARDFEPLVRSTISQRNSHSFNIV